MSRNNPYVIGQRSNEVMHVLHPRLRYPDLWRGCVGAWAPCLGPGGLILQDNSGRGNHGTLTNMDQATDWVASGGKMALETIGSAGDQESIKIGSFPFLATFCVSAWAYHLGTGFNNVVGKANAAFTNAQFYLRVSNTGTTSGFANASTYTEVASPNYTAGVWTHWCLNYTGAQLQFWKDGINTANTTSSNVPASTNDELHIGRGGQLNSQYHNGYVDDVRIYSGPLTGDKIRMLALRRGIAYETKRRRSYRAAVVGGFKAAWLNQRSAIIGGGVR